MKSNKILALILSVAMLFTMSITAFADESTTFTNMSLADFNSAIANGGNVTLNNNTKITDVVNPGVSTFSNDCVLDLNGKILDKGDITFITIAGNKNVTIKNGTIAFAKATDSIFRPEAGSTLNLENVIFSQDKSNYQKDDVSTIINAQGACTINISNCTMTGLKAETAVICTNTGAGSAVNITKTNISSEDSEGKGVALFGGVMVVTDCEIEAVRPIKVINDKQTVILTGKTTVKGTNFDIRTTEGTGKIIKAGSDVTFEGITDTSAIETATCIVTGANGVKGYASLSDALQNVSEGDVIKLLANDTLDNQTYFKNSIDLNGHTLTLKKGSNYIQKDITISNGDIVVGDDVNTTADCVINLFASNTAVNATFENVNISTGKSFSTACGLLGVYNENKLTYNGGKIVIGNNNGKGVNAVFNGGLGTCKGKFDIQNVTVTVKKGAKVEKVIFGSPDVVVNGLTFDGVVEKDTFSKVSGTISNSTFNYKNTDSMRSIVNDAGAGTTNLSFENVKFNNVPKCTSGVFNLTEASVVKGDKDTEIDTEEKAFEAKIGDTYYSSFANALTKAEENDTITLLADAAMATGFRNNVKSIVIDLNQKKLTVDGTKDNLCENVTFKNGNIKVIGDGTGTAAFYIFDKDKYLVFDNVKIDANAFTGTYLIADDWCNHNGRIEIINGTEIYYNSDTEKKLSTVIHLNDATATLKIDNSKINVANTDGHIINNSSGDVVISGNSEITGTNVGTSGIYNVIGKSLTIKDNAVVTITGVKGSEEWNPEKAGIVLGAETPYIVADTATVNADVYRTPGVNNLAEEIAITFADVTENEGEKVYDIYAETATDKTINGLTALQLALKRDTENAFAMTVTGPDGMPITAVDGLYLFNYDGTTKASATGVKIKIGQVKLVGNGTFTLSIDETKENFANTTSFDGENTDVKYVTASEDKKLDISNKLENITIKAPTKDLAIKIDFKSAVESQVAAYQNMTVTVTGPDNYKKVFELGSDKDTKIADNKAEIEIKDELAYRARYNVEVKGAGYRTVNYQVIMDDNKTLNFWNNYKDTAVKVEENDGMPVNTTFLAGDILPDGRINIYDLSAVVSYFGMKNLADDPEAYAKYAQFDLNRDGKINSEDVAYVLISWGK